MPNKMQQAEPKAFTKLKAKSRGGFDKVPKALPPKKPSAVGMIGKALKEAY